MAAVEMIPHLIFFRNQPKPDDHPAMCSCGEAADMSSSKLRGKALAMIYEEDFDSGAPESIGSARIHRSRSGSGRVKRSKSMPEEEFSELARKLRELERMDSNLSGKTRDSGFNSEHEGGSVFFNSFVGGPPGASADEHTGSEIPSAIFGCNGELHSGFLDNYGLDGPLAPVESRESQQQVVIIPAASASGTKASNLRPHTPLDHVVPSGVISSNTRRKRKEELKQATIRQHYYPEGGWGFVIVLIGFIVQTITHGLQMSFGVILLALLRRFEDDANETPDHQLSFRLQAVTLGCLSISISLILSPITVGVCRRKSTRITAVMGGLVTALGLLFASFATQFHQLVLSYGFLMATGVGMTRDTAGLMVGQYFKRKRELVEIITVASTGVGIALMSIFFMQMTSQLGWRLGLQAITGVVVVTFFLGTFYRSASLYHPQRRAILHLKTQKRKIKNKDKEKNKLQDDTPPFFDFSTLRSRTVQIMLLSTFLAFIGINAPLILMGQVSTDEGLTKLEIRHLQIHFGLSFATGCFAFGVVVVSNSTECRIARQYLCQAALILCGLSILSLTTIQGYNGYLIFAWIYGISYGGYLYSIKMYIFEKVRARNFARAWGFAQFAMGLPQLVGIPLTMYMNSAKNSKQGFVLSATSVLLASVALVLVDLHKRRLRHRKRKLHHTKSINSTTTTFSTSSCPAHPTANSVIVQSASSAAGIPIGVKVPEPVLIQDPDLAFDSVSEGKPSSVRASLVSSTSKAKRRVGVDRQLSFSDQDDIIPPISLLNQQRSFVINNEEDIHLLMDNRGKAELTLISEENMLADLMDLPDNYFLLARDGGDIGDMEDMEYLENITSCNKVENVVMLSEFEQNLSKEKEGSSTGGEAMDFDSTGSGGQVQGAEQSKRRRRKKWPSLFKRKNNQVKKEQSKMIGMPVIEENSV